MAIFQGDFGKGVTTNSGIFGDPGVSPWVLYGPVSSTTSVMASAAGYGSNAVPQVQFRLGMVTQGDFETEWVFCRYVVSGPVDILPGQVYGVDENFNASLLTTTTAAAAANSNVYVGYAFAPATASGTYYLWLARAGNLAVQAAASSLAFGQAQSGATAGQVKFLNTHTAGTWTVQPLTAYGASSSITFKADTVNGSPQMLNVTSQITGPQGATGGITDLIPGMVFTGTGITNGIISTIDRGGSGGSFRIGIGTNTTGNQNVANNCTNTATQGTFTVTSHVAAKVYWPSIANAVT
jgi:hypothetical protein